VGGVPVPIVLEEGNAFRFSTEALRERISPRTKLLILNSPSNPTGSLMTASDMAETADAVRGHDMFVLTDEIYSRIVYGGGSPSLATFPGMKDRTIILDGFSKTYCMTGWRLGYGIMHEELAEKVTRLIINANSCTTHFVQTAGLAALQGPQDSVDAMVAEYARRRDVIAAGLGSIEGITCRTPDGAFYAFPNVSATGVSSTELAHYLLEDAGVAVLDGAAFGSAGAGYLRLSYATSMELIHQGLERIEAGVKKLAR
jgi:aspartate/methionine/tyrosine aminotransferase